MELAVNVVQIVIALGIFNVWILRFNKPTAWRGGGAGSMEEEFAVYGLPAWSEGRFGFLKLALAAALIAGVWLPGLTPPAAVGLALLMLGAVVMHVKVRDPVRKSLPAFSLLVLSSIVAFA